MPYAPVVTTRSPGWTPLRICVPWPSVMPVFTSFWWAILSRPTTITAGLPDLVAISASFGTVTPSVRVRAARDTGTGEPALYLPVLLGTVTHTSSVVDPGSNAGL